MVKKMMQVFMVLALMMVITASGNTADVNTTLQKAKAGDPVAQIALGLMYNDSRGVPQDYKKATEWFTKAAKQGDADEGFASAHPAPVRPALEQPPVTIDRPSADNSGLG